MGPQDQKALDHLRELGSRPATPFFEDGPAQYIVEQLEDMGVPAERDRYGNIVAHYSRGGATDPPIAFVAHMDHPGFELTELDGDRGVARAMGGVPAASLTQETKVLLVTPDGSRVPALATPHEESAPPGDRGGERLVRLAFESPIQIDPPASAVFDLPDFELDGDVIRARALDDLAGCAAILTTLERTLADGVEADVYGVFTRAEEEGLYGARLMAEADTLPADTIVVSVESSSVIPGVAQGDGPVVRTGDAAYTFDADAESVLAVAAESLRQRDDAFKSQRQLMSGGVCEATAFAVFGYSVTGLAFPLGNYHNATTNLRDESGGVDAEYIHLSDFLGGVDLLTEAARGVGNRGETSIRRRMREVSGEVRERLRS